MKPTRYTLPTIATLRHRQHSNNTSDKITICAIALSVVVALVVYLLESA